MNQSQSDESTNFPATGVNKYIRKTISSLGDLSGQKVMDCPAGDGRFTHQLEAQGATVTSADLFPEFFTLKNRSCDEVDLAKPLPYADKSFDKVVCFEGIEHLADQLLVMREFSRVLKDGGQLLISTPNISQLKAKISYLLCESEYYKRSAPSEMDSVWFSEKNKNELYFGHVFLINSLKLRTLGIFNGLEISKVHWADLSPTSILLLPFLYPFILFFSLFPFVFYKKKLKKLVPEQRSKIMWDQYRLNCSLKNLLNKHMIILFRKERSPQDAIQFLKGMTRQET